MALAIVLPVVCALGLALSLKSASVLRGRSRWTIFGWLATSAYLASAGVAAARSTHPPFYLDDVALVALTIGFVVAGIRDEPQAEPWWWPTHAGPTGAERRTNRPG